MPKFEISYRKDTINEVAESLIRDFVSQYSVFGLVGEMGAGKTTLVKELMEKMGTDSHISSPSYALVNEYQTHDGTKVYHMDLQRIDSIEELWELGIEEYLGLAGAKIFIEWPEIYFDELGDKALLIRLQKLSEDERKLTVEDMP